MSIPTRVRHFAKSAYQLNLMTGRAVSSPAEYICQVFSARGYVLVTSLDNTWYVPIAKAWLNL